MAASKIAFAYIYIVYYYDVDEPSRHERLLQVQPVACTSLQRAVLFIKPRISEMDLEHINPGQLWRYGNYWIERTEIIDSFDHGLEWESQVHDGKSERKYGRLPLKFD